MSVKTSEISCRNVWKVFGATREAFERAGGMTIDEPSLAAHGWTAAVRDASFDIARGEVFVLMRLSGSGKSIIVRCLSRLIEASMGAVHVERTDLLAASHDELIEIRRRKMGMVFKHSALLPNRDALGNVAFPLQVQGVPRAARAAHAREEMVSLVGFAGARGSFPARAVRRPAAAGANRALSGQQSGDLVFRRAVLGARPADPRRPAGYIIALRAPGGPVQGVIDRETFIRGRADCEP